MKKKMGIVESAMRYWQIMVMLVIMMGIIGIYALMVMPRQEFPSFTIRQGLVIGVYPGASSEEVEEQLTSKVEKYLFSFKEIKKKDTYSVSKDGMMIVFVELDNSVKNSDEFWAKLNHGLNNFKAQLPSGVLALFTNSDFGDTSALLIAMEADNLSYRRLETYMDELEDRLRRIESVSKLNHIGLQPEQISIYLEKEKLTNYAITPTTLLANLFTQGFTTMSGTIDNEDYVAPIHISPSFNNEQDLAEQIIYSDPLGNIIRLKDVARIVREYPDPDSYITNNGHQCLLISMEMLQGNNIVQYGKEVDEVLRQFQSELPEGVNIERVADQPKVVDHSISNFLMEMGYAIIAVILVTMILLPLRVATVAASTIPITIFISLGIMLLAGMELNTVTLAALIVVLGMIVDNSVVILDSYMEKLDHGMSRWHAAISSAQTLFKAIFSATLAISITFFPFLFTLKGMFRDFVELFPWTLTITLGVSLIVAMFLIPFLEYAFIRRGFKQPESRKTRRSMLDIIQQTYEKWLEKAFKHPRITMTGALIAVLGGIFLFTLAPQRLFPTAERDQFAVEIYLPQGSSLKQTTAVTDSLEKILQADSRVVSVTAFNGTSSPRFHTTYAPNLPARNYAQFIVNTRSNRETVEMLDEYTPLYAGYFPNAHVRFKQLDYQDAAFPIEVRISANNLDRLKTTADSLLTKMRKIKNLTWVHTNYEEMLPGAKVTLDPIEANRLGISKTTVSTNLAIRFDGLPLTTLWEKDYPVSVKLKAEREGEPELGDIENEYIHSLIPGISVPLRQIAQVEPEWTQGKIVRRNGVRTISIVADVTRNANTNQVFREVRDVVESHDLPEGLQVSYGGAHESDIENLPPILSGLLISIFIIFMILVFHFRKINLALLVLGSATLSFVGAMAGILLLGKEIGLTSLLGIVSLIGILVRNGIIMLDYAEELRMVKRKTVLEAAMEAGKRRMRPIFLTSAAASMGVVPMIISNSSLWAPMGTIICFGTMTSMVLLVLILPVAYWLIFRKTGNKKVITEKPLKQMKPVLLTFLILMGASTAMQAQNQYTLEQCKSLALQNNAEVKNKALGVESAREVKKAAFTKYFPEVEATALSFRFDKPMMEMELEGGNLPVYDGNPANLPGATQFAYFPGGSFSLLEKGTIGMATATQPLYAGSQISTGNKLADLGVEVSELQLASAKNQIVLQTENQYWQIVSLKEKKKTLERYMAMVDTLHKEVADAWEAGLITRNDLLKVELKQNELQMNNLKLENGIELARMALCQYIGVSYSPDVVFEGEIPQAQVPGLVYTDHRQALGNRAEYQMLQKSTEAETYQTRMTRGEYLPQVGVGVSALYLDIMNQEGNAYGGVFGTVKIPLSGWWEASHKMKERRFREEQNKNMVNDNTEKLLLQMQQAKNSLDEAYKQVQLGETAVGQAEENLKITRDHYDAGLVNVSDMLDAQAQFQESHNQYVDALTHYQVTRVNYLQLTGR
ncbi:MAG: efflux RND transporter permease subunit [Mangrovibacterium sp.]|nr:efflux RND transporter permease subunit [Mangrovibacterium sp.]